MSALGTGFGMGLLVAAQIGPMSLFLIRSVLRGSLGTGLAIGAGIAAIDTLYAAAGAAGAAPALSVGSVRGVLGLFAAASVAGAADSAPAALALLTGVGLGSLTAVSALAVGVSVSRRWVGPRL